MSTERKPFQNNNSNKGEISQLLDAQDGLKKLRRLAKLDGVLDALHRQQLGHLEEQQLRTLSDVLAAARAR